MNKIVTQSWVYYPSCGCCVEWGEHLTINNNYLTDNLSEYSYDDELLQKIAECLGLKEYTPVEDKSFEEWLKENNVEYDWYVEDEDYVDNSEDKYEYWGYEE